MPTPRFLDPSAIPLKRQSGMNIWSTLVPVIQVGIVIALIGVVGLFFLPVIQTENTYKSEIGKLQRETAAADERQTELKLETEHLKTDPAYLEHIARDQLNMGKPGETIIRFDKYQASTPATMKIRSVSTARETGS